MSLIRRWLAKDFASAGLWACATFVVLIARPGWSVGPTLGAPPSGIFEREEPNLAEGERALRDGRPEDALRAFRQAQAETQDERAIVEYDVGQALLQQGLSEAEASAQEQDGAEAGGGQRIFAEAAEAFDRAYGLTTNPQMQSAAAQAAGNARAQKGDLQAAVDSFRKAMIADPNNMGARKNLASVLRALAAQPPPPPSESDEDSDSKDDSEQNPKDGEQNQEDSSSEQGQNDESSNSQAGDEQDKDKSAGEDKQREPGTDDKNRNESQQPEPKSSSDEGPQKPGDVEPQAPQNTERPSPEERSKEQAQRLLDQMRNREKPLVPLWMRGKSSSKPPPEKDW